MVQELDDKRHPKLRRFVTISAAVVCFLRGLAYVTPGSSGRAQYVSFVDTLVPMPVWAGAWMAASVAILLGYKFPRFARWGLSTFGVMMLVWCASYLFAFFFLGVNRSWTTAALLYFCGVSALSFMFLMEPHGHKKTTRVPQEFYDELDKGANRRPSEPAINEE